MFLRLFSLLLITFLISCASHREKGNYSSDEFSGLTETRQR